jgi:hypothetical protein
LVFFHSDDERRVKKFREKHAATVIQQGWRKHKKRRGMNGSRQTNLVRSISYLRFIIIFEFREIQPSVDW